MKKGDQDPVHDDRSKVEPENGFQRRRRSSWFDLIIVLVIVGFFILCAIPNYTHHRHKGADDNTALSAGRSTVLAYRIYFQEHQDEPDFAGDVDWLEKLLIHDRNLNDDPRVTFSFAVMNKKGFTFTTRHKKGKKTFVYDSGAKEHP